MKNDGWTSALFSLIFIAAPALAIFFFALPLNIFENNYGYIILLVLGFILFVVCTSWLMIYLEFMRFNALNFIIPISLVFISILISSSWPTWSTAILCIISVFMALPTNIFVNRHYEKGKINR